MLIANILHEGGWVMDFEGYCVKCKAKRSVKNGNVEVTTKGTRLVKGICPKCGTKVTRFLPKEKAESK